MWNDGVSVSIRVVLAKDSYGAAVRRPGMGP
jgi:hypothetical protein